MSASTKQRTLPTAPEMGPQPPCRYEGGTLPYSRTSPTVIFSQPDGSRWKASAEVALRNIDQFPEPDRSLILFDAGLHYGMVPWLMVDPSYKVTARDMENWVDTVMPEQALEVSN